MSIDLRGPAENFLTPRPRRQTLTVACLPFSRDGSSYYRLWLPWKHLKEQSLHQYINIMGDQLDPNVTPDVTVLQRPAGVGGLQMIERIAGQTKVVYEVDDNMLEVDPSGLPHLYDERVRESIRRCIRLCDMVTCSSESLAETVRPFNDNVVVLPNFVKAELLDMHRPKRERLTIGWAGGTSHLVDMVTIQDALRNILNRNRDVDIHFVGFDFSPLLSGVHKGQMRRTNWVDDVGHYYKNIDFDIAIAPSADIPFNRSKTPIRALETAALGIPIVAANRAPYSDFVQDGKTGFLVDDKGWERALQLLINDEVLRISLGQNAREQAADWTIQGNWHRWEEAYEQAASL